MSGSEKKYTKKKDKNNERKKGKRTKWMKEW